ncbi:MAG: hypothetical protein RJA70_80 [Pseudomonadota bacterium]|jgi:YD repeat-containing protein
MFIPRTLSARPTSNYTYSANGELDTQVDTTNGGVTDYDYDARGSLLSVTLPDTRQIEYTIDGQARRVANSIEGAAVKGCLYKDYMRSLRHAR